MFSDPLSAHAGAHFFWERSFAVVDRAVVFCGKPYVGEDRVSGGLGHATKKEVLAIGRQAARLTCELVASVFGGCCGEYQKVKLRAGLWGEAKIISVGEIQDEVREFIAFEEGNTARYFFAPCV